MDGECTMHAARRVSRRALGHRQHLRTLLFILSLLPPHSFLRSAFSRPRDVRELRPPPAPFAYNNECVTALGLLCAFSDQNGH
jgi:hypothetical protein